MTSIFDQFEQASQVSKNTKAEPMTSSGYITMQMEDNSPLFSKQKMNLNPSDVITHMSVASDYLVLAMANGKLFRIDLKNADQNDEIIFSKSVQPTSKLSGVFLDPLGYHFLMSFAPRGKEGNPELLYMNRKTTKLKSVSKSRNYEVTEVGWNYENKSDNSTGPILLGTSQGHILEMEIEAENDKLFGSSQPTWRQIFDIGKGTDTPITGIKFHRVNSTNNYFVFITTPNRLYQFMGQASLDEKPCLQSIFHTYLTVPETGFQEIPSSLKYSKLQFFYDKNDVPKTFAWLTEPGIFHGQLDPTCQQNANSLFTQGELINYVTDKNNKPQTPLSFVLTEFHALLMYSDKVKAVSLLNQELVYEDTYSETHGKLKDIVKDPIKKTIWAVTEKAIFRYKVNREDRNVWRIYSDKQEFDLAKLHAQNNPAFIDAINIKQADLLFSKGDFDLSAAVYAETQSSFETICLKFLEAEQLEALQVYLRKRLEDLSDNDITLIPMLVIWMIELFLSQLSSLRRLNLDDSEQFHRIQSDLEVFLLQPKVVKCMKHVRPIINDLMSSHGDKQNLMKLNMLVNDHEGVISQYVYRKSYLKALDILQGLKRADLFYQFGSDLLEGEPKYTVNALIALGPKINPVLMLPAFLSCTNDERHMGEVMRYLEFMLQNFNVRDRAIHNYLLTLYAEYDHALLMKYLARQGQDIAHVNYDVHYALRLCREKNLTEACVKLSALLGLWESAVEQALEVDIGLAKNLANMPDEDPDLQRNLWLKIAEHEISRKQEFNVAMSLLEECPLLKIEDILQFFSDIVTIDHFRQPICQSLQEYNNQIEELKAEMEEATKSAEYVRAEIQSFRNCRVQVSVKDCCSLCEIALLLRPFYLFPCGHKFHSDCLTNEVQPTLDQTHRTKLSELQHKLNMLPNAELSSITTTGLPLRDVLRSELDEVIASECVYCGEHMIQSIDKPFVPADQWESVLRQWE